MSHDNWFENAFQNWVKENEWVQICDDLPEAPDGWYWIPGYNHTYTHTLGEFITRAGEGWGDKECCLVRTRNYKDHPARLVYETYWLELEGD